MTSGGLSSRVDKEFWIDAVVFGEGAAGIFAKSGLDCVGRTNLLQTKTRNASFFGVTEAFGGLWDAIDPLRAASGVSVRF